MKPTLKTFSLVLLLLAAAAAGSAAEAAAVPGRFAVSSLDRSFDRCTDFYEFACGSWRKANPIPADQTR